MATGIGLRIYLIDDNDFLLRLSMARYRRLSRRELDERLPQYAGKRVRCATVVLELAGRKPVAINRINYHKLSFDAEGRLDSTELERQARLAVEVLPPLTDEERSGQVINARSHFAKKRYGHEFKWTATPEIQAAIVAAIFGKESA